MSAEDILNKEKLLKACHISKEEFERIGLSWDALELIRKDYINKRKDLEALGESAVRVLNGCEKVHSLKLRIKSIDRLMEKITRKKLADPASSITMENYEEKITDLIGIRILHLYKDDWKDINTYILQNWQPLEKPKIYFRQGDILAPNDQFDIIPHEDGYRSIHYLIKLTLSRKVCGICEIQVRTIFEEGWSEINHQICYPKRPGQVILDQYLRVFNRLAGSADEMGTYVRLLDSHLQDISKQQQQEVEKLNQKIEKLKIDMAGKKDLLDSINNWSITSIAPNQFSIRKDFKSSDNNIQYFSNQFMPFTDLKGAEVSFIKKCARCGKSFSAASFDEEFCSDCKQ